MPHSWSPARGWCGRGSRMAPDLSEALIFPRVFVAPEEGRSTGIRQTSRLATEPAPAPVRDFASELRHPCPHRGLSGAVPLPQRPQKRWRAPPKSHPRPRRLSCIPAFTHRRSSTFIRGSVFLAALGAKKAVVYQRGNPGRTLGETDRKCGRRRDKTSGGNAASKRFLARVFGREHGCAQAPSARDPHGRRCSIGRYGSVGCLQPDIKLRSRAENPPDVSPAEQTLETCRYDAVAVAGCRLQRLAIQNGNAAPAVADHSGPLQRAGDNTHAWPIDDSMRARNSCVIWNSSPPARSCAISNQRARRCSRSWRPLHAAVWLTCEPMASR